MSNLPQNGVRALKDCAKGLWLKSWVWQREFYNIVNKYDYRESGEIQEGDSIVNFPGGNQVEIYGVKPHHIGKNAAHFHCILVPKNK